jgi:WD40 repeat protein
VSFARDGSTFLWNAADGDKVPWAGMTRIWDAATRREQPWVEHMKRWATAFSPDGALLATAGDDQIVRLWDPASGQLIGPLPHPAQVSKVLFSEDGTRLATAADDGKIRLWDPASGEHVMSLPHDDAYGFSQDGARLVTTGADKTIRLWDTTSGQELSQHQREPSFPVIVSPDRTRVAYFADTETAQLLDMASGVVLASMRHDNKVQGFIFSPDGRHLATRSGQMVYLWAT